MANTKWGKGEMKKKITKRPSGHKTITTTIIKYETTIYNGVHNKLDTNVQKEPKLAKSARNSLSTDFGSKRVRGGTINTQKPASAPKRNTHCIVNGSDRGSSTVSLFDEDTVRH